MSGKGIRQECCRQAIPRRVPGQFGIRRNAEQTTRATVEAITRLRSSETRLVSTTRPYLSPMDSLSLFLNNPPHTMQDDFVSE